MPVTLDFETYSEAGYYYDTEAARWRGITPTSPGLPAVGAAVYCEHPSARVLSLAWDMHDGLGVRLWLPGMPPPVELLAHVQSGGVIEAHNAFFEYCVWHYICAPRLGWPPLRQEQMRCSAAKCRAHSLPGKLEKAAEVLGAPEQKDGSGAALIRKLTVPKNTKKQPTMEEYDAFYRYNMQDVRAETAVSLRCPDLSAYEQRVWHLDQAINFRGVSIDRVALSNCIEVVRQATVKYTAELQYLTSGSVQSAGEIAKLIGWLGAWGVRTGNLDADALDGLLARTDLQPHVRRVLEIRAMLGSASVKKLNAIERRLNTDGRLRDLFVYCGADRTGRFAGRGPQPQNMPGGLPVDEVEKALDVIASRPLDAVEFHYGDAIAAVAGCLRGLFCAAPGHDLICSDFSAIEAVVLAELAGETWRQEVFRTHGKIYEASASKITGVPFEEFMRYKEENGAHHPLRKKIGKPSELASGYGGGLGAWKAFGAGEHLSDEEIQEGVKAWRAASPAITSFWWGVQDAAICAINNPGHAYHYRAIAYQMANDKLYCRLPSGRCLTYHNPRVAQKTLPWGKQAVCIKYMGWNTDYKVGPTGWIELETYGPKLTENIVQAVSRDILVNSMLALDAAGYPIVLHVHDEIVAEVPQGRGSVEEFEQIMGIMPSWAAGWPVRAAGGWRGLRYRKE